MKFMYERKITKLLKLVTIQVVVNYMCQFDWTKGCPERW